MIRKELLQSAQQIVSAGLIGEGVKVVFDATVPFADLKNRVMHLRPMPEEVDEIALLHLRADCDHEMGHFGVTDPLALTGIDRELVKSIVNSVEDGFIERWVSERWLGCAQNLAASNAKLAAEIRRRATDDIDSRRHRAVIGLSEIAFGHTVEQTLEAFGQDLRSLYDEVADILPELPKIDRTQRSIELAIQLADRWQWGKEPPPPTAGDADEKEKGEEKRGEKGEERDGDAAAKDEAADEAADKPSETAPTKPAKKKKKGSGKSGGKGRPEKVDDGAGAPKSCDADGGERKREDAVAAKLGDATLGSHRKTYIASTTMAAHDRYRPYTQEDVTEEIPRSKHAHSVESFIAGVRATVPPLRRRLLMEFLAVGQRFQRGTKRGQLDQRALHKVTLGLTTVFQRRVPAQVLDADVTLLVDASGSMSREVGDETALYLAAESACAFSMVLDLLRVPHECLAFTTLSRMPRRGVDVGRDYERVRPLRHLIVKAADKRFRQCRGNFAALAHFGAMVENIDGEAVLWAARRLAARHRSGRVPVLIVFSDGWPDSHPEDADVLRRNLKRTVERVEAAGIACVGIGIGSNAVRDFYKNHTVIRNVSDLVATGYIAVRDVLRASRR